jgi:hypothetical protein
MDRRDTSQNPEMGTRALNSRLGKLTFAEPTADLRPGVWAMGLLGSEE